MRIVGQGTIYRNPHPSFAPAEPSATTLCWSPAFGGLLSAMRVGAAKLSAEGRLRLFAARDGERWEQLASPLSALDGDGLNHAGSHLGSDGDTTILAAARMAVAHYGSPAWGKFESGIVDADTVIVRASGASWETPRLYDFRRHQDEWAIPCGPPLPLGGSKWILPMESHARSDREGWLRQYHAFAVFSDDDGRSWGEPAPLLNSSDGDLAYYDQRLTQVGDGRLYTVAWVHNTIEDRTMRARAAYSEDGGHSWSDDFELGLFGGPVNPLSLGDHRMLAVYNRRVPPTAIVIAESDDAGRTWALNRQLVLWDERQRKATGEPLGTVADEDAASSLWQTMWAWTFGTPTPVRDPAGAITVAFHAAGTDGVGAARWVRLMP